MSHRTTWEQAERILCVRLDALGDVLMTSPAIRALKESRPGRRLALLTSPSGAAAAALLPEVDETIVYDAPWMKATAPRADSRPELAMADALRGRFDAAVVFTVYSQNPLPSAFLCYLADIPLRLAHCRENPYQLLTHWVPDPEPERVVRHEVRRQLDLVAEVGARTADERMSVRIPARAVTRMRRRLAEAGLGERGDRRWVVVHPGATAASRRYPAAGFAQAARRLARDYGYHIVLTGSDSERPLIDEIREGMGGDATTPFAGVLSLEELAALIADAPLLIANNTGPVHLAAALGTPVVDLYALTNPQHTPWEVPHRVLSHDVPCRNCYKSACPEGHHHCLRKVDPEEVVRAALELLGEPTPTLTAVHEEAC